MNIYVRTQDSDLLKYLDESESARVSALAYAEEFADGAALLASGSRKRDLLEITFGRVVLWETTPSGKRLEIDICEAGELLGEVSFVIPAAQPLNASAIGTVRVLRYPGSALWKLMEEDPNLAAKLSAALNDSLCRRHVRATQRRTG
jgi:CRP/FNR family transcriptional regulator, dissimilatory nitrate respiration regulator